MLERMDVLLIHVSDIDRYDPLGTVVTVIIANKSGPRERDVLRQLARGMSNNDIASNLFLTEGTVRNYVSAIFTKLGVTYRTQAAVIALRHSLAD